MCLGDDGEVGGGMEKVLVEALWLVWEVIGSVYAVGVGKNKRYHEETYLPLPLGGGRESCILVTTGESLGGSLMAGLGVSAASFSFSFSSTLGVGGVKEGTPSPSK